MIRYEERRAGARAWLVLAAVCVVSWLLLWSFDPSAWTVPTLVVGIPGVLVAAVMLLLRRGGTVRLTDEELRAGGRTVALADIAPGTVTAPGAALRGRRPDGRAGPGLGVVRFTLRDGTPAAVPARDPEALAVALYKALEGR